MFLQLRLSMAVMEIGISCYQISTIGFTSEYFRAESGITFWPDSTLEAASELDTIVIPGGDGLRRSLASETIAEWLLARVNETRRVVTIGGGIYGVAPTGLLDGPRSHHSLALR